MNEFEYLHPDSVESAAKILGKNLDSIPYAGGTDVLGLMKDDIISPSRLVNLKNIDELSYIKYDENNGLRIGALTKLNKIAGHNIVKQKYKVLEESIKELATYQLRNVGTIGGNICQRPRCFYFRGEYDCIRKGGDECYAFFGNNKYHCIIGGDPCYIVHPSDTAVALSVLDAKFKISDGKAERIIPIAEFFILPGNDETKENVLQKGEILTEIIIPPPPLNTVSKYIKVKERGAWDFALVSIAGIFQRQGNLIKNGKIAFGGVAPIPWVDDNINKYLNGMSIKEKEFSILSQKALQDAEPLEMNSYKITLSRNLVKKILIDSFLI